MPVLIVHGLSYFSYDWIDPAARIAADREVVAIDMRGFGKSDWSPSRDYKLETLSRRRDQRARRISAGRRRC